MSFQPHVTPRLCVVWHGRTVVGCVRKNNEDSLWASALGRNGPDAPVLAAQGEFDGTGALLRPGALLAVADGMGGAKAGEIASGLAVNILRQEMEAHVRAADLAEASAEELRDALVHSVEVANERIREEGQRDSTRSGMGTTLTALWVYDEVAQIAHVGDSRAYLFRRGNLQQLTRDQSLVEKLLEDNIITAEEAENMAARNIILQALGSEEDLEVAEHRLPLQAGDLLLLCTDGLCGVVANRDLEEALRRGGGLEELSSRLILLAEGKGGPDNITVLLGRVEPAHQSSRT